jgi:hypothetical protein
VISKVSCFQASVNIFLPLQEGVFPINTLNRARCQYAPRLSLGSLFLYQPTVQFFFTVAVFDSRFGSTSYARHFLKIQSGSQNLAKKKTGAERRIRKRRSRKVTLSKTFVTLQTKVIKKRNGNNFSEQPSPVTNEPSICLHFVNSVHHPPSKFFVACDPHVRQPDQRVYNCCHMLKFHPGLPR